MGSDPIVAHVPITGQETIGIVRPNLKVFEDFDAANDCALFKSKGRPWTLGPGWYAIFHPVYGAHAPGQSMDGERTIRKLVIKVREKK